MEKLHATVYELKVSMGNVAKEVAEFSAQVSRIREEVSNADLIRHEETATNEEAIKDVQDAQLNLTQAMQILTDFCAKVSSTPFQVECSTVKNFSASTARFGGPSLTTEIRWEVPVSLVSLQVIQSDLARLESENKTAESEAVHTFDEFTGNAVEVSRTATSDFCPTVVQVGANVTLEDYQDVLHHLVEKA